MAGVGSCRRTTWSTARREDRSTNGVEERLNGPVAVTRRTFLVDDGGIKCGPSGAESDGGSRGSLTGENPLRREPRQRHDRCCRVA